MKPAVQGKPLAEVTSEDPDSKKLSQKRRRKRTGVAVAAVLVISLAGVAGGLTAAYIMAKYQPSIRERVYNASLDGTDVSVRVATDPNAMIVVLKDGATTIVGEYNKGFTVYATPAKDGEISCFIRLMDNTTANFSILQQLAESSAAVPQNKRYTTVERIVGGKIKDVTFLSTYAQQACYGHDTYWITPYESKSHGVTKRLDCYICIPGICFSLYCMPMRCFFTCYFVSVPWPPIPGPDPDPLVNPRIGQIADIRGK